MIDCEGCTLAALRESDLSRLRVVVVEVDEVDQWDRLVALLDAAGLKLAEEFAELAFRRASENSGRRWCYDGVIINDENADVFLWS